MRGCTWGGVGGFDWIGGDCVCQLGNALLFGCTPACCINLSSARQNSEWGSISGAQFGNISLFCTSFDIPLYCTSFAPFWNISLFCTSFPPDLRPAGPPGMEIWPNPLNLNLSQFQEEADGWKSRCNWISPISSLTGWTPPSPSCCWKKRWVRAILTRPSRPFNSNIWNISRQLTQLTLGWVNLTVHTYLALGKLYGIQGSQTNTCRHSRKQQDELLGEPGAHLGLYPRVADHDGGAQEHVSQEPLKLSVVPSPQLGLASPYLFLAPCTFVHL